MKNFGPTHNFYSWELWAANPILRFALLFCVTTVAIKELWKQTWEIPAGYKLTQSAVQKLTASAKL